MKGKVCGDFCEFTLDKGHFITGVAKEKKELEALYRTSDIQSYDVLSSVNCCRHIDADGIICLSVAIQKVFALLNICVSKESSLSELKASFLMKSAQE